MFNPFTNCNLCMWTFPNSKTKTLTITCIANVNGNVVTGSQQGHVIVWNIINRSISPASVLIDPSCDSVASLASCEKRNSIFSCGNSGSLSLWNLDEMICNRRYNFGYAITQMEISSSTNSAFDNILFCTSDCQPNVIMFDFERFVIISKLVTHTPWSSHICSFFTLDTGNASKDLAIIGLSSSGIMRLWAINSMIPESEIMECENKSTPYPGAKSIIPFPKLFRIIMLLTNEFFAIIDGSNFLELAKVTSSNKNDHLVTCKFHGSDRIICIKRSMQILLYSLDVSNFSSSHRSINVSYLSTLVLSGEICSFVVMEVFEDLIVIGQSSGKLQAFSINFNENSDDYFTDVFEFNKNDWIVANKPLNKLISASRCICLQSERMFAIGCEDGCVYLIDINLFLSNIGDQSESTYPLNSFAEVVLRGHCSQITSLLHPHSLNKQYDNKYLLSAAYDLKVLLWEVTHPECPIVSFDAFTSSISSLFLPIGDVNNSLNYICCHAFDGTIHLISLNDRRQISLLRGMDSDTYPLQKLYWQFKGNLLVARSSDGHVYVWHFESGKLERVSCGNEADEIIKSCSQCMTTDMSLLRTPLLSPYGLISMNSINIDIGYVHVISFDISSVIGDSENTQLCHNLLKAKLFCRPCLSLPTEVFPGSDNRTPDDVNRRCTFSLYLQTDNIKHFKILNTLNTVIDWALSLKTCQKYTLFLNEEQKLNRTVLLLLWVDIFNELTEICKSLLEFSKQVFDINDKCFQRLSCLLQFSNVTGTVVPFEGSFISNSSDCEDDAHYICLMIHVIYLLCSGVEIPSSHLKLISHVILKLLSDLKSDIRFYSNVSLHCCLLYLLEVGCPFFYEYMDLDALFVRLLIMIVAALNNVKYQHTYKNILRETRSVLHTFVLFNPQEFIRSLNRIANKSIISNPSNTIDTFLQKTKSEITKYLLIIIERGTDFVNDVIVEYIQLCILLDPYSLPSSNPDSLLNKLIMNNVCIGILPYRILVGTTTGCLVLFDSLPLPKYQTWDVFTNAVTSVSFSPDIKQIAAYCEIENRIFIGQITSSAATLFSGSSSLKEVISFEVTNTCINPKFVWLTDHSFIFLSSNGDEIKYLF
ncbi:hypothetical protein GJ496_009605 [Pomphorhynchus laevis]|nr:hypothetical protein GJ496_009605 [Pomphorhynchus laevis]